MRLGIFIAIWLSAFAFAADQKPGLYQLGKKDSYVMVREGKSDTAPLKYVLSAGQVFQAKDIGGGWLELTVDETGGKMSKSYVNTKAQGSKISKVNPEAPVRTYIDHPQLPGALAVSVIASESPVYSGAQCKLSGKPCPEITGNPQDNDEMKVVASTIQKVYDPYKKEIMYRLFYKVRFKNWEYKQGGNLPQFKTGWVNADDLRTDGPYKTPSLFPPKGYSEPDDGGAGFCVDCPPDTGAKSPVVPIEEIQRELKINEIDELMKQISPFTDDCLLKDPSTSPILKDSTSAFDAYVGKNWAAKTDVPTELALADSKVQKMRLEDWQCIDALARTVFGEMDVCEEPYMIGVAATIVNRAKDEVAKIRNLSEEERAAKVSAQICDEVKRKCQYSVWNSRKGCNNKRPPRAKANESLKRVLCPTAHMEAGLGKYDQSLKIAITAILRPNTFAKVTAGMNGLKHYTSGSAVIEGMVQADPPVVNGEVLDKANCTVWWREMTKAEKEAAEKAKKAKKT